MRSVVIWNWVGKASVRLAPCNNPLLRLGNKAARLGFSPGRSLIFAAAFEIPQADFQRATGNFGPTHLWIFRQHRRRFRILYVEFSDPNDAILDLNVCHSCLLGRPVESPDIFVWNTVNAETQRALTLLEVHVSITRYFSGNYVATEPGAEPASMFLATAFHRRHFSHAVTPRRNRMSRVVGAFSKFTGSALALMLIVGLAACGGPPNWVKKGSGAYNEKNDKSFYGVGSVVGVRNEPLAWDTAENRSRAEIAKTFETYTAYLMRDYAASTTAGDFSRNSEEQNIERAVKTFSAVTLNGVKPIDRYKDDKSGTYYVLTKLSLEDMKNNLDQAKELNGQVRDFVRKNADRLFERLEKEEEKRATK
jgi:hypothetical protein